MLPTMASRSTEAPSPGKVEFKRWLFAPPRPHGAIIKDRTVSNLELFYDLVYVAVIGQASRHLASNVSLEAFAEFAVVFTMIWFAWFNGSLYIELHGREDSRTRLLLFFPMGILALMAMFAQHAAGATGTPFAIVYAAFLAFMGFEWYGIRQLDRVERPEFMRITAFYVGGMLLSTVAIAVTAVFPHPWQLVAWAVFVAAWLGGLVAGSRGATRMTTGILPTDSLVER